MPALRLYGSACFPSGLVLAPGAAFCQNAATPDNFGDKTIEELMNVDVTTVSRKEQKLSKVPAAVYVITREAIQRSGATNIPDLLRVVPGVQVAQVEADRWAISIRGFNASYSNKLLVLVDGRTIYNPSFSGVYWDQIDIPLDTIERIEIVRGSGGAIWGANAVNGVINIITENSKDTRGAQLEAGSGSHESEDFQARYGGKLGNWGTYRISGDYRNFNGLPSSLMPGRLDGWDMARGAFRIDGRLSTKDQLTVDGDGSHAQGGELFPFGETGALGVVPQSLENNGFHVLGKWTHTHSDNSESSLQIYTNNYRRTDSGVNETSDTVDVDFENHTSAGSRNDIVWGAGFRRTTGGAVMTLPEDQALGTLGLFVHLSKPDTGFNLFSGFIQDELTITKRLSLTLGTKLEHNSFTGFQVEPTVRLAWTPNDRNTFWGAFSRSTRQPSLLETGVDIEVAAIPVAPGFSLQNKILASPHVPSEVAKTYEAGYRVMPNRRVSVDLTSFYNIYTDLHVTAPQASDLSYSMAGAALNTSFSYLASGTAETYGAEAAVSTSITGRWRVAGTYSYLHQHGNSNIGNAYLNKLESIVPAAMAIALASQITSTTGSSLAAGSTPARSFSLQSNFDATRKWEFDQAVYYVDALPAQGLPSYVRLDLHTSYKLPHGLKVSLVGQNLLSPRHLEFNESTELLSTQVERSIFGKFTWSF